MPLGLLGGLAKIGGGLAKAGGGLAKAGGGLLKGGGGELLKGLAGKGMEIAQGAIQNAIQGGGQAQQAEGGAPAEGGGAAPAKKDPIAKLAEKIQQAPTAEKVDEIVKKVTARLEKKGKLDPETKKIIEALAQNKKQELGGAPAAAAA